MELKTLAAAAALTAAVATPALAQDPIARSAPVQHPRSQQIYYHDHYADRYYGSGFWPADVAAGVVGGAIGTAGAIATAPFRNDVYAYNHGYYDQGFVCQPGTVFRGADGRRHICQ